MRLEKIEEYALSDDIILSISALFQTAFEGYPNELIYYNQIPDFRILAWNDDDLVGHVGVDYRKISVGGQVLSVFGIVDLCVDPDIQLNKMGTALLQYVFTLADKSSVDFIVLSSEEDNFYLKNGFFIVHNPCKWLVIHQHDSIGVFRRILKDGLMIKACKDIEWPEGEVDFMGHMF